MINNKFVYFPPSRKEYFFSLNLMQNNNFYFLYSPLSYSTKIFWGLLLISNFFRLLFTCNQNSLPIEIKKIIKILDLKDASFQVKRGTHGPDQKITLVRHSRSKTTFFKIGSTERGIELIKKEFDVLNGLKGRFNAPNTLNFYFKDGFQFMETDYIIAPKVKSIMMNEFVYDYIVNITSFNFNSQGIYYKSFNHGDCCPWNFLQLDENNVLLIDWELAGDYILGYDLFTFIFQPPYLLTPSKSNEAIIGSNINWIRRFFNHFNVENCKDYLNIFVNSKLEYETKKGKDSQLIHRYIQLKRELPSIQL